MPDPVQSRLLRLALALSACALCAFSWPGRAQRLMAELRAEDDPRARADLVRLLGTLADSSAQESLLEAARDRETIVRAAAPAALAALGPAAGESAREALVSLLSDPAPAVRAAAARALGELLTRAEQPEQLELLLRSFADEEPKVRAESARALGMQRSPKALAALGRGLSDESLEVQSASARALGEQGSGQALALLSGKLAGAAPELRQVILEALGAAQGEEARAIATRLLADDSPEAQRTGLRLVLRLGLHDALEQVEVLAGASDASLAEAARTTALALRAPQPAPARARPAWLEALLRSGDPRLPAAQVPELLSALEDTLPAGEALAAEPLAEWLLRAQGAYQERIAALLARTGQAPRAGALAVLLARPDPALRSALCAVLAHADARQAAALLPLLGDAHVQVREAAARALGALADLDTLAALRWLLTQGPGRVREPAALALALALESRRAPPHGHGARRLRRALLAALDASDPAAAAYAARALGALDPAAASELLAADARLLASPARSVALLRASLGDRSSRARAERARRTHSRDPAIAATAFAAQILADEQPRGELLLQGLEHARWPLGPLAAFALARATPPPVSVDALCAALRRSAEPNTRRNLQVALAKARAACPGPDRASAPPLAGARGAGPRALQLDDGSVLISFPDAARDSSWPGLRHVIVADPWQSPYGSVR